MNGVLQNTLSPTVQPFSLHSNQTYLINPSQQHRLISRGVYPLRGEIITNEWNNGMMD